MNAPEGAVLFATDTGKIYMVQDGEKLIFGGSGSGASILYGIADEKTENENHQYLFSLDELENREVRPAIGDLILNKDGTFFKIIFYDEEQQIMYCSLIAVSGSGSGTVEVRDVDITWDERTIKRGNTYVYGQDYDAIFIPTTTAAGDTNCTVTFEIIDNEHNKTTTVVQSGRSGAKMKFNMKQLPQSTNITLKATVTSDNSQYNEGLGYPRNITNLRVVIMDIVKPSIKYLPIIKPDDTTGKKEIEYMPLGQKDSSGNALLDLFLHVYIDGVEQPSLKESVPASYYDKIASVVIPRQTHGVHKIELRLSADIGETTLYTNSISYEVAWADSTEETPIIWIGKYDETIVNYENSYIYYMVFDPISYKRDLPAEVHFYKENAEISQSNVKYSDDGWLIWDISNDYTVGNNNFSIACRTTKVNIPIYVTTAGSRDLGLVSQDSLLLNMTTAGRSSSEIKSQRTVFKSTVNEDKISASLLNFNWQNNGWKDSQGADEKTGVDSGSYLSIANDAKLNVVLSGDINLNQSKNYSIEFRFRVTNVQEYSTLIKTVPKYFYDKPIYDSDNETIIGWEPTYTIVSTDEETTVTPKSGYYSLYEREIKELGYKIGVDKYGNLLMDEENTIKTADISSGVIIKWLNDDGFGLCVGTQEAFFRTPTGITNVRYCEDEVINLTFVISKDDSLCYVYLNGILSGAIGMPSGTGANFIINKPFEFNSDYCDLDLYRFRVYETGLTMPQVIHNYLADMHSIQLYDQNQLTDPLDPTALSYPLLVKYNQEHPDNLSMPYTVWQVNDSGTDELLPWKKGNVRKIDVEFVNPNADGDLQKWLDGDRVNGISPYYYYLHSPSFYAQGVSIDVQGTSSQKYPRRNYKTKFKDAKDTWVYTKGPLANKPLTGSYYFSKTTGEYLPDVTKDTFDSSTMVELTSKFHEDATYGVNKFTWKIDFMESSGSYNTGFANLVGNIQEGNRLYSKHPLDDLNLGIDTSTMRTSVYGFPVLTFHKYSNGNYEYIGRYNMNLDKGANEAYGFENKTKQPYVPQRTRKVLNKETNIWEDETYQPTIKEIAECWEMKDNQGYWCSMRYPGVQARLSGFGTLQEGTFGENAKLEILNHYEYRYSFYADELDAAYEYNTFTDANTQVEYSNHGQINTYLREKHSNLEKLFNWLDSTDTRAVTNSDLPQPIVYQVSSYVTNDDSIDYEIILTDATLVSPGTPYAAYIEETVSDENNIGGSNKKRKVPIQYYIKKNNNYWYYKYDANTWDELDLINAQAPDTWDADVAEGKVYRASFSGLYKATFTKDTVEYRRQKFRTEFSEHLDKEYCLVYFVLTELLLCYDSRGKNMMLASFGPKRLGGEYIWYPIFYDIDTQLGLNNSGAYLWDYDADVTKDNLFSTPTSVLWNNLYDVYYNEVVEKYRVLRGVSNPASAEDRIVNGSLTETNIVGAYECNPTVFGSHAMKGVRPIIAIGLDEYYKYLAPALKQSDFNAGKIYAGYYDTTGAHLYQQTPTYIYTCQGDKKLTTELLVRNRLNYLDSQWKAGNYTAGVVENEIFLRANANLQTTSDLFLDSKTEAGFTTKAYPVDYFDARPGAKVKPYLHQYVFYFHDGQASVPVKYDGSDGQEDGVWTNVDAGKLEAYKNQPDLSQQITYFPGGDYISSLGDLSLMYPNAIQIFHGKRMLDFRLGSDIPGYKNPGMNSPAVECDLPEEMPLLKMVNLSRLSQFKKEMYFTGSAKLQEFRALGSAIERVNFAPGSPLHTVHLPSSMTTVVLMQHKNLNKILTSPPVVVLLNNETGKYDYQDPESYRGLYIEGVTDYNAETQAHIGHKLTNIAIEGGGLGYNSYIILKNLFDLKYGAVNNKNLRASLVDVEWTPYQIVEIGTSWNSNETYYELTDHSTFELYNHTTAEKWYNDLLNEKIYVYNSDYTKFNPDDSSTFNSEERIIQNLELLDNFISEYENGNNQFGNTSGSSSLTIPTITGTLYVSNDNTPETLINEALLTTKYKKYFPNLTIQAANIKTANITKYVRVYDTGKEEILTAERTDGVNPNLPSGTPPTQTNWDFKGWSLINPNTYTGEGIPPLALVFNENYTDSNDMYTTTEIWDNLLFDENNTLYTLYAIFELHAFNITFINGDGSAYTKQVIFNTQITAPDPTEIVIYKDDSGLAFNQTYHFSYWSIESEGDPINLNSYYAIRDYTFYSVFEQQSVYDSLVSMDNFVISEVTYSGSSSGEDLEYSKVGFGIAPKASGVLKGKITIPTEITYNNKTLPIVELQSNSQGSWSGATHIFFENAAASEVRIVRNDAFYGSTTLRYFEMPHKLRVIGNGAFRNCQNLSVPKFEDSKLYLIDKQAFNNSLTSDVLEENYPVINITFPGSLKRLDMYSFANRSGHRYGTFIFGSEKDVSQLIIDNVYQNSGPYSRNNNANENIRELIIYVSSDRESYFTNMVNEGKLYLAQDGANNSNIAFILRTNGTYQLNVV